METEKTKQTFSFKTNIKCDGCIAKVTPVLNVTQGICHWEVDTEDPDKILTVHSDGITEHEIIQAVQKAGFSIEQNNL